MTTPISPDVQSFSNHILNKGCDKFVQESDAITIKSIIRLLNGFDTSEEIGPNFETLMHCLGQVLPEEDEETIVRDATVKRICARMKRAWKKRSEPPGAAEDGVTKPPQRDDVGSQVASKLHKRNLSKTSEKSFKSHSDYRAAGIHIVAEHNVRGIQDALVRLVFKVVPQQNEWIQGKPMQLQYRAYGLTQSSV